MDVKIKALSVHLLTATGAVLSMFAMLAAVEGNWQTMFLWLVLALLVDGIDGPLARRYDTPKNFPIYDGVLMDLIVDYLTYVFIPAYALFKSGLLPGWTGWTAPTPRCPRARTAATPSSWPRWMRWWSSWHRRRSQLSTRCGACATWCHSPRRPPRRPDLRTAATPARQPRRSSTWHAPVRPSRTGSHDPGMTGTRLRQSTPVSVPSR